MWRHLSRLPLHQGIAAAAFVPLLALYVWGAMRQATEVNTDALRSDQGAYLRAAERMRATGFRYLGDRNRMPLYPGIQAVFAHPEADPEAVFERAKRVNVLLSVLLLAALFPILRAWLPALQALTVLLLTAFTIFLFKAGWVQAEILFYFLSFAAWLLMVELLRVPSWTRGLLAGVLAGLAYLTKASVLPTIAIWALWSGVVAASEAWRKDRARALARLASTGAVLLMALTVVFPYLADNKRIFGHWFYNVNTNFYAWCDSWEDATRVKAQGAMEHWPTLPADQTPSPRRYLETHSAREIAERLATGSAVAWNRAVHAYAVFEYLVLYGGLAALLLWRNRSWALERLRRGWAVVGFLAIYFAVSFLLVAWYVPIASGSRFVLAHYLPFLFTIASVTAAAPETSVAGRPLARAGHLAILMLLLADIPLRLLPRAGSLYGGH